MNRLDKVVVFRTLSANDMRQILDIELNEVQTRIMSSQTENQFIFRCTTEAKDFLLREGTDVKYGARHLKRAIERHLVFPLSNLIATGQIGVGDVIKIDMGPFWGEAGLFEGTNHVQSHCQRGKRPPWTLSSKAELREIARRQPGLK